VSISTSVLGDQTRIDRHKPRLEVSGGSAFVEIRQMGQVCHTIAS
jgi:hypothetical protein